MSDVFGAGQAVSGIAQAAGSVAAANIQADAANHAADLQSQATANALNYQQQTTAFNQQQQLPYITAGQSALGTQQDLINDYNGEMVPYMQQLAAATPKPMTEANLVQTPGYQFNLSQGLESTQNSAAARGLGVSGAAMKGAATYATGLADSTYQNQFNNQQTLYGDAGTALNSALAFNNQLYNQNAQQATLGGNVAVQAGTQANQGAQNAANTINSGGAAQGAASIAQGNAYAGGINGIGNSIANSNALAAYNQQQNYNNNGSTYGGSAQNADSLAYAAAQNAGSGAYGPGY